jgi:hypothetical protein
MLGAAHVPGNVREAQPTGNTVVPATPPAHPPANPPRPRGALAPALKRAGALYGVKAVGSFVPRLTRKAFEKYGFSAAALITDWPAVAGKELAAYAAPERLKWPRAAHDPHDEAEASDKGRPGATLVLRVDGGRSLDVQHNAHQIIERINAYFGYAAIRELRIVQAPLGDGSRAAEPLHRPSASPRTHEVAHIADPGLRDALARLGAGVRAGR